MSNRILAVLLAAALLPACVDNNPATPDAGPVAEPEPPEPEPPQPEPEPPQPVEPEPSEPEPSEPEPSEPEPPAPEARLVTDFSLTFENGTNRATGELGTQTSLLLGVSAYTENCDDCAVQLIFSVGDHFECALDGIAGPAPGIVRDLAGTLEFNALGAQTLRMGATLAADCDDALEEARRGDIQLQEIGTATGLERQFDLHTVDIAGQGEDAKIAVGSTFDVALGFDLFARNCPGCVAQVVVGIDGESQGCAYDGIPGDAPTAIDGALRMRAPQAPGRYEITIGNALEFSCGDAMRARRRRVIGYIDVVAPNRGMLQMRHSGKCLDVFGGSQDDAARVIQWSCGGTDNQRFIFAKWEGQDLWQVRPIHSEKCLDVRGASQDNGGLIQQYACVDVPQQKFALHSADGGVKLRAAHSSKCIDTPGGSHDDDVQLIQWDCQDGADEQLFDFGE